MKRPEDRLRRLAAGLGLKERRWFEELLKKIESRRPRRGVSLWIQISLGLMIASAILRDGFRIEVPEVAITALALIALAGIAVAVFDQVKHRRRRQPGKEPGVPPPGEHTYRAYTGLGVVFALILSIPGVLFAVLLFLYLLASTGTFTVAAAGAWLLFVGWFAFCLLSFMPVTLQVLQEGIRSWFPRLRTESPIISWSQYKARHLVGPVFYVPPIWSLPLSWFVVRRSRDFRRELREHGHVSVEKPART